MNHDSSESHQQPSRLHVDVVAPTHFDTPPPPPPEPQEQTPPEDPKKNLAKLLAVVIPVVIVLVGIVFGVWALVSMAGEP